MSAQSFAAVLESGPPFPMLALPHQGADPSLDVQWAAWIERGRVHDLAVKRKMRLALLGAAVISLFVVLVFVLTGRTQ